MMKRHVYLILFVFIRLNICNAQDNVNQNLIGVWESKVRNTGFYMVFIDKNSGAFTDSSGLTYSRFNYQTTPKNGAILFTSHAPNFHKQNDSIKSLLLFINDTTLSINSEINGKAALLMRGKNVLTYKKQKDLNAQNFVRRPTQEDLIGSWLRIFKKDTSIVFNFKKDNILELRNFHTGKQIIGEYHFNPEEQPMLLDIINDKGEKVPTICMFDFENSLRIAGPKNGKRRSIFTTFGDNFFLIRELRKSN